jgi:hypothetical protein
MRELKNSLVSRQSLAPELRTATATGTAIDRSGFESVTFNVHVGAWTDGVHAVSFEHSTDDSTYSAVTAAELVGTAPTIQDDGSSPSGPATYEDENLLIGYIGDRQYIRPVVTVTGSPATGAFIGIDAILGHAHDRPV